MARSRAPGYAHQPTREGRRALRRLVSLAGLRSERCGLTHPEAELHAAAVRAAVGVRLDIYPHGWRS